MTRSLHKHNLRLPSQNAVLAAISAFAVVAPTLTTNAAGGGTGGTGINKSNANISDDGTISFSGDYQQQGGGKTFSTIIAKYKIWVVGALGIATVTMVALMIKTITGLAASATNPQKRSQQIVAILVQFIATAGLGAVTFIVGVAFNAIGSSST